MAWIHGCGWGPVWGLETGSGSRTRRLTTSQYDTASDCRCGHGSVLLSPWADADTIFRDPHNSAPQSRCYSTAGLSPYQLFRCSLTRSTSQLPALSCNIHVHWQTGGGPVNGARAGKEVYTTTCVVKCFHGCSTCVGLQL